MLRFSIFVFVHDFVEAICIFCFSVLTFLVLDYTVVFVSAFMQIKLYDELLFLCLEYLFLLNKLRISKIMSKLKPDKLNSVVFVTNTNIALYAMCFWIQIGTLPVSVRSFTQLN